MSRIHATAIIESGAVLGADVEVGPYCAVGPHAVIGDGTRLISHVVVDGHTTLGSRCEVHPFARLGGKTQDLKYDGGTTFVEIGDRTVIRECVTVNSGTGEGEVTKVGSDCLLMAYSHVAHGCDIGNGVIMANGVQLAGEVVIEESATLGGLVGIHQFCRIGTLCMIGGASKATQDVPPYMLADGAETHIRGVNVIGLKRRGFSDEVCDALKKAYRLLYRSNLNTSDALAAIEAEVAALPEIKRLCEFYRTSSRGVMR